MAACFGLFDSFEMNLYQPALVSSVEKNLDAQLLSFRRWKESVDNLFLDYTFKTSVRKSFLQTQEDSDIAERALLMEMLFSSVKGLSGIRIIGSGGDLPDKDGIPFHRIHFSTFESDVAERINSGIIYKNYEDSGAGIPFSVLECPNGSKNKVAGDPANGVMVFSFPLYDSYSTWRGTIAFYVSPRAVEDYMVEANLLRVGDVFTIVASEDYTVSGLVRGMPEVLLSDTQRRVSGKKSPVSVVSSEIVSRWEAGRTGVEKTAVVNGISFVLFSKRISPGLFLSVLIPQTYFEFSPAAKLFFLCAGFISVFLLLFFILCMKQDPMSVARRRIRTFQFQMLHDVIASGRLDDSDGMARFCGELDSHRRELSSEIKKDFSGKIRKKYSKEIDSLLDKSWDEILAALGRLRKSKVSSVDTGVIREMVEQALHSANMNGFKQEAEKCFLYPSDSSMEEFGKFERFSRNGSGNTGDTKDSASMEQEPSGVIVPGNQSETENIPELEYLGEFTENLKPLPPQPEAVTGLDVVGDTKPAELLPAEPESVSSENRDETIVNRDGIYVIDSAISDTTDSEKGNVNSDFQKLVDSVLL